MSDPVIPIAQPATIQAPWLLAFTTLAQDGEGRRFDYKADTGAAQRDALTAALATALQPLQLTWLTLEHGAQVVDVGGTQASPTADAAVVVHPGFAAALTTADCLPVLVIDLVRRHAAVIHAGWRGIAQDIIGRTLGRMAELAGSSSPQSPQLCAWIGPSIKQEDYEVGPEVREQLLNARAVSRDMFAPALVATFPVAPTTAPAAIPTATPTVEGKYRADLQAMATAQLVDGGVPLSAIEVYPLSTLQSPQLHSVRRDAEQAGRMATVVGIRATP